MRKKVAGFVLFACGRPNKTLATYPEGEENRPEYELRVFEDDDFELYCEKEMRWVQITREEAVLCVLFPQVMPLVYHEVIK